MHVSGASTVLDRHPCLQFRYDVILVPHTRVWRWSAPYHPSSFRAPPWYLPERSSGGSPARLVADPCRKPRPAHPQTENLRNLPPVPNCKPLAPAHAIRSPDAPTLPRAVSAEGGAGKQRAWTGPNTLIAGAIPSARDGLGFATVIQDTRGTAAGGGGGGSGGGGRLYVFGGIGPSSPNGMGDLHRCPPAPVMS